MSVVVSRCLCVVCCLSLIGRCSLFVDCWVLLCVVDDCCLLLSLLFVFLSCLWSVVCCYCVVLCIVVCRCSVLVARCVVFVVRNC